MARGGKRPGAGRKPGVPNKVTAEARALFAALLDKKAGELEAMIDETRFGIEIEKQIQGPNGQSATVLGRLNADPGKAVDLILKLAEFCIPKLGRQEHVGGDGESIRVIIQKANREG